MIEAKTLQFHSEVSLGYYDELIKCNGLPDRINVIKSVTHQRL